MFLFQALMKFSIQQELKENGLKAALVKIGHANIVNKNKHLEEAKNPRKPATDGIFRKDK